MSYIPRYLGDRGGVDSDANPVALSPESLRHLIDSALEVYGVPLTDEVTLLGHTFTFRSLDHGEMSDVLHSCRGYDVFTRELEIMRRVLAQSVVAIDGAPVGSLKVMEEGFRKWPPAVISAMYQRFAKLRELQESIVGRSINEIKKEQPSPMNGSDGNWPSSSDATRGTEGSLG